MKEEWSRDTSLSEAKTQGLGANTGQLLEPQQAACHPAQQGKRMLLAQGGLQVPCVELCSPAEREPEKRSCRLSPGKVGGRTSRV